MDEIFGKKSNSTFSNFHTQNEDFINLKEIAGDPQSMAVLTKNPISGHVTRNPIGRQIWFAKGCETTPVHENTQ